ncbi:MAG TPA: RodZ domain-containing protein [Vicinamibacteria bacterium]|jgi:transcriptional regulator with XRE-family HTH domain
MASLSERLRRERELRGISLQQISEETRIGVRFLEALEEDRLDIIPGEFYRRSYLRAYTRYLGLDEDRALNVYDYSRKDRSSGAEPSDESHHAASFRSLPPWVKWAGAVIGLALPLVLLFRPMPSPDAGIAPLSAAATDPSPPVERPAPLHDPAALDLAPSPFAPETSRDDGKLRLVLSVEESCWLEIVADGEVVISGLKDQGFHQEVTALRELRLWLGNAGGVKLLLNDRPAIPLGRPGQVRKDLTITLDNYRDFVSASDRS